MINYKKFNYNYWNRPYYAPNVESFIFRLKSYVLDRFIDKNKKLTFLDYGCGEGSTVKFLDNTYNYKGYGVDISSSAINVAKKKFKKERFKKIKMKVEKNDYFFKKKFDLIISIQTLYYLDNEDLKNRLISFKKMLKPNGYVYFTMMSIKNHYFKKNSNKKVDKSGLTLIDLSKDEGYTRRQKVKNQLHYINFTKNKKDLCKKFRIFKPLSIGSYDLSLENYKKSEHHFTFFGQLTL